MSSIDKGTFSSGRYGCLTRVLVMAGVTYLAAELLGGVEVNSVKAAIATAMVIAVLDNLIRPILLVITLPLSFVTNGLFVFVVNTAIVMMASGFMGDKFVVDGWGWGLLFSLVLTVADYLIEMPSQRSQMRYANRHQDDSRKNPDDEEFTPYEEVND